MIQSFEIPTDFVPLDCKFEEIRPRKPTVGNVKLKIDCSKIGELSIDYIIRTLQRDLKVHLVGGDLIYAEGSIKPSHYESIWRMLDCFDVKIID